MATPELVEERFISGRGLLKIPQSINNARYWLLYLDVIRNPINEYKSLDWNPTKSVFARMVFRRKGYVIDYRLMEFEKELFTYVLDISGQTLIATKCAYEGTLQTFANLGNSLVLPTISVTNLTANMASLQLGFDEVLFKCYSSTALQVRLFSASYELCGNADIPIEEPFSPPPPIDKFDPNDGIGNISPAYDPVTNDDGNTQPFGDDQLLPGTLRITWNIGANGSLPSGGLVSQEFTVPNETFVAQMRNGTSPSICATISGIANVSPQPQETWAVDASGAEILLVQHNTCNFLAIVSQEYV